MKELTRHKSQFKIVLQNLPNKACNPLGLRFHANTGRWGVFTIYKYFPSFEFSLLPGRVHARENAIWKHYGVRLFELFDLRRPDLWEQYMQYLKELENIENEERRIKGQKPITRDLPQWRIC